MRRIGFYLFIIAVVFLLAPLLALPQKAVPAPTAAPTPTPTAVARAAAPYRAVWVSYLEWEQVDFSSAEAFTQAIGTMLDNIQSIGATVVLAQVRPFGDALYPSDYFPFSHLCTGTQGQDPGFDPLALLVDAAHARDLQLEACQSRTGIQAGCRAGAVQQAGAAAPGLGQVHRYRRVSTPPARTCGSTLPTGWELCARYAVDGIHFDDYFYPTTDPAFDAADYAASGSTRTQDDWRRENVNALMELCHAAARRYGVRFGAAPAGDPEQNYTLQYSDAARWLRQGTVDYLMPQLYWGQEYIKNGDASHSFAQLAAAWAALPRAAGVKLYAGLGAYRVGAGDGSDAGSEWFSGHALADQLALLARLGVQGAGLYRYGSLFANSDAPALAESEAEAIKGVWQG